MRIESDLQHALDDQGPESGSSELELLRPRLIDELDVESLEAPSRPTASRPRYAELGLALVFLAMGALTVGGAFLALVMLLVALSL